MRGDNTDAMAKWIEWELFSQRHVLRLSRTPCDLSLEPRTHDKKTRVCVLNDLYMTVRCARAVQVLASAGLLVQTQRKRTPSKKKITWQQYRLCLVAAEHRVLGGRHFLILGPESRKIWWLKKVQYLQKKYHCKRTLLRGKKPKWIFHNFGDLLRPLDFVPASRVRVVPTVWQVHTVLGDCKSKAKVISIRAPLYRQC